jgi:hypothetical protein
VLPGVAIGSGVGQAVSLATNRKAGPPLQAIAIGGVLLTYVIRTALLFTIGDQFIERGWGFKDFQTDIGGLIATGIASFIAVGRLR